MTIETPNHTLENTRKLASEALERASTTVKEMRSGVQDAASRGLGVAQVVVANRLQAGVPVRLKPETCRSPPTPGHAGN